MFGSKKGGCMKTILCNDFTDKERMTIEKYCGDNYVLLDSIEGDHYILNEEGELYYNDCFKSTINDYLKKQRYEQANPIRIIQFFHFYIMESNNDTGIWYRGNMIENRKYEYDIYGDSLEEIFDSL